MSTTNKPSTLFWVIAVLALLWNLTGVSFYLLDAYASKEMLKAMYNPEQLAYVKAIPAWLTALYAIATWGGLLGAILLLIRKKWAALLFIISTLSVTVQTIYGLTATNHLDLFGSGQSIVLPLLVIIIGFFLYWWSKKCTAKNWLR